MSPRKTRVVGTGEEDKQLDPSLQSVWARTHPPAPDLGLSPEKAADLEIRVKQFLHRWEWRADTAIVRRELYELLVWLQAEEDPPEDQVVAVDADG